MSESAFRRKNLTKIKKIMMGLGILSLALVFCGAVYAAEDATKVAPNNHKVLLENENVRVIEFTARAGDKIGMHSHPNHVVYILSDAKATFISEEGKSEERAMKAGDTIWVDAVTHATEHGEDAHAILVELKK
jgi:quercetin dioxygenase-like cupin family protein